MTGSSVHDAAPAPRKVLEPAQASALKPSVAPVTKLQRVEQLCCPTEFAPGGDKYLTIKDGGLWLRTRSGAASEKLLDGMLSAKWTKDGTAIVFSQAATNAPATVGLLDVTTRQAKKIGTTRNPWRLPFDAHGRVVVFTDGGLQTIDPDTNQAVDLPRGAGGQPLIDAQNEETEVAFSPDGRHVAVLEDVKLSLVDLQTRSKVLLTDQIDRRRWAPFGWSSDGSQISYSIRTAPAASASNPKPQTWDKGMPGGVAELWLANADGTGARRLVARHGDITGFYAGVNWIPGTRSIVYQFFPDGGGATLGAEYQMISADGGTPTTLFTNGLGLTLSSDGRIISFVRDLEGKDETGNWIAELAIN
jgi:Tol biopolymer transport system component